MANCLRSYFIRPVERFLGRQPHLRVFWLGLRNRAWRTVDRPLAAAALAAICIIVLVGWLAIAFLAPQFEKWIDYLDEHASWLMILAALQAATSIARRRTRISAALRASWLATAPRAVLTRRSSLLLVVIWAPIAQLALLVLVLLMIQHLASSDASVVGHLITVIVGSYAGGMVLGGVFSRRRRDNDRPSSRYIPSIQATSASHGRPSLSALARWPIASAFAWATPGTVRWPMMAAMLSVMSGSSALAGLLVVGFWMMMLYMITLLHSTLRVAEQAANWLRCTPISFRRFAVAICARSLLHQLLATAVIASLIAVETGTPFRSVLFAAPWIALVLVAYSTKVAYVFNARRGARISIAVSALSIAILEYLYRGAAVPLALLVCVWHFRWGAHAKLGGAVAHVT